MAQIVVWPVVFRVLEGVLAYHDKACVMPACDSDIVGVVEPKAELRYDQGVCGRVNLSADNIGLEVVYRCLDKVCVVPPSCCCRIARDRGVAEVFKYG